MSGPLQHGAPAPRFSAAASDGQTYTLEELLARGPVALFFYPGNDTPG
jgi:peroxiredoxin